MKQSALEDFSNNINRLIQGEELDLYETMISASFERIAGLLFDSAREQGIWYDGVDNLQARRRKSRQIEFHGNMWVAKGSDNQWKEPFYARVTDKSSTREGLWIKMKIGEFESEGNVYDLI